MTYFECVKVVELLTEAGRANKNFLGQYTDADMARWADVVKRYEAGSVFLVDTAQFLTHRVGYEVSGGGGPPGVGARGSWCSRPLPLRRVR